MKKPKKPTKKEKKKILIEDLMHTWDGCSVKDAIKALVECLEFDENASFKTEWNYDSSDINVIGTESDDSFEDRMAVYEERVVEWKKFRVKQLQDEINGIKET